MAGRPKPRRLITDQSSEEAGKSSTSNSALNRYSRDLILKKYNPINLFPGIVPDDLLPLYLPIPDSPCLSEGCSHPLQSPINSRKAQKKKLEVPQESPKKQKSEKNLSSRKKNKNELDLMLKEELKDKHSEEKGKIQEENEGETVFMVPVYDKQLLLNFVYRGNPFAKAMLQTGINAEDDKIYFPLGLRPYERVWFYKDPQGVVQGPFSCIEMFNWTLRGCFPPNLQISFANTEFVPMDQYLNRTEDKDGKKSTGFQGRSLEDIKEE